MVNKIRQIITEELAEVSTDPVYPNAIRNSDKQNTRIEHNKALQHRP